MLKKFPFYPLVFSLFPVLSLAAHNIFEISPDVICRPLAFSLLLGGVFFFVAWLFLRDLQRSALVALVMLFLFFTYGQIYNVLEDIKIGEIFVFRHRLLLPFFIFLTAVLIYGIWKKRIQPAGYAGWVNLLSLVLLISPALTIITSILGQKLADKNIPDFSAPIVATASQPDIYYIILDAYGREDVLSNKLGYDNSEFVNSLTQRGFYVARCSQSNYAYTQFSLPSSLNYDYLLSLNVTRDKDRVALLRHGAVRSFLEANGYKVVAFPTGWYYTEWHDADLYLDPARPAILLTEFEELALKTTLLRPIMDLNAENQNKRVRINAEAPGETLRRLRTLSVLRDLKNLPELNDKLFVFAHILLPHPPYSFDSEGGWVNRPERGVPYDEIRDAYIDQVKFANREILDVIDAILEKSKEPPIIILQGDHGPPPELSLTYSEKLPILNAYYLPSEKAREALYPSISPVNSFRVVFNSFFDQELPILKDRSYYSDNNNFDEKLVPNSCPADS